MNRARKTSYVVYYRRDGSSLAHLPNRTPKHNIQRKQPLRNDFGVALPAAQPPLGNNRDFASRAEKDKESSRRYRLQATARRLLPDNKGIHQCMRRAARGVAFPTIESNGERSRLTGVHRCKQGAICPVCAPKIAMAHAKELAAATTAAYALGWRVLHITYTLSHHAGESLEKVLSSIADARRKYFLAGRGYAALKSQIGIEGSARALEVTNGCNGWHPHFHVLVFVSGDIPDDLEEKFTERWLHAVAKVGAGASRDHALRIEEGSQKISEYLNKFGRLPAEGGHSVEMEVSHGYAKNARKDAKTPFALLEADRIGEEDAAGLFREYAGAMAGRALIRWSKGLRAALGLETDQPDEASDSGEVFTEVAALSRAALLEISDESLLPAVLTAATAGYETLRALLEMYDIIPDPRIPRLFIPLRDIDFVYI